MDAFDSMVALKPAQRGFGSDALRHVPTGGSMCGRHPMHLFMIAVVCSSAMSCRRDNRVDDEAAIRAATREWNAAEAAKDLEKCVSFYAEDGERFASGSPAIRGAAALRKEWQKYLSSPGTFQWDTSKVEVSSSRDLAYETGSFVLKTLDKSGQPVTTI